MKESPQTNKTSHIFRAYDIRGIYGKDLDEDVMESIGRAFSASFMGDVVVARDGRESGESLSGAFIRGALSGNDVISLGMLPLGAAMFKAWSGGRTLAYVTASHLGREWNGIKFFSGNGIGFMEADLERVREAFGKGLAGRKKGASGRSLAGRS